MTRSRSGFMFLRGGLACLLLMGMVLFAASARAEEGDKPQEQPEQEQPPTTEPPLEAEPQP